MGRIYENKNGDIVNEPRPSYGDFGQVLSVWSMKKMAFVELADLEEGR